MFTEGAESAGNTVTEFFLDRMDIHGCKGCFGGHSSKECPCVQKDDMAQIYPAVKDCDVVVADSKARVDVLDVVNDVAAIRITLENYFGANYVDFHAMKKDENGWKIMAKVFTEV